MFQIHDVNDVNMTNIKWIINWFLFQMRDGGSVAVSLRTVGHVVVSGLFLKSDEFMTGGNLDYEKEE